MNRPSARPVMPLALGVVGPVIWAGSGFLHAPASAVVGALGALVGVVGAVWAHVGGATFHRVFVADDWRLEGDEFVFAVTPKLHRRGGQPIVKVNRRREDGDREEVVTDVRTLHDGTVVIASTVRFDGEVLIQ